jgi:hypothetical protein
MEPVNPIISVRHARRRRGRRLTATILFLATLTIAYLAFDRAAYWIATTING